MDSRIHLGEGFSVPHQQKEMQFAGCWIPATPHKPIPIRPNSIPIDRHQGQFGGGNWQEMVGFPGGYAQDLSNYSRTDQHVGQIYQPSRNGSFAENNGVINHFPGSFTQALLDEDESWNSDILADVFCMNSTAPNRTLSRSLSVAEMPLIPNLNAPVHSFTESHSSEMFFANQTHCSSSNLLISYPSWRQISQYGLPTPHAPNTFTSPSIDADAASSVPDSFQFAPVIKQAKKLENQLSAQEVGKFDYQPPAFIAHQLDKSSREIKDKQNSAVVSIDNAPNQYNPGKFLHNIMHSSSAVISTLFEGPKDSCQGEDQAIDLNQTPKQKTPKRRKHRPKVIVEGKPKNSPKAATKEVDPNEKAAEKKQHVHMKSQPQPTTQDPDFIREATNTLEKPKEKRKYVRKNQKEAEIPNTNCIGVTSYPSAPSCRKALSFAMENTSINKERNSDTKQEILYKTKEILNLNMGFQVAESFNESGIMCRTKSSFQTSQQNVSLLKIQQSGHITEVTPSINQRANNNLCISERREGAMQLTSRKDAQMDILEGTAKDTDVRVLQRNKVEGIGRTIFPSEPSHKGFEKNELSMSPSTQSVSDTQLSTKGKGYKREYLHVELTRHGNGNPLGELLCQERFHPDEYNLNSHIMRAEFSETYKKQKIELGNRVHVDRMPPSIAAVNPSMGKVFSNTVNPSVVERDRQLFRLYSQRNYTSMRYPVGSHTNSVSSAQELQMLRKYTGPDSFIKRIGETSNISPPTPPKLVPQSVQQPRPQNCNTDASEKQATALTKSLSVLPREGQILPTETGIMKDLQSSAKRKGQPTKEKFPITIEEIICRMEHLSINKSTNETALVPYKGDGTLIPYEGFIKKRKPRPKVDLDPETERVWKLLMWKEGAEGLEGTNQKTKQWWEEERRVFRGRADSFIARMHLVQGDRRFSKWKGSVVDSVIGVFLTQNVSDHLSSSAFMHLAAKYPPRSIRNRTNEKEGQMVLVQETEICVLDQTDAVKWQCKLSPFRSQISKTAHKSAEQQRAEFLWTEQTSLVGAHSDNPEEEIFSSQDSIDSSVIQCNGGVRSYSGSSSEAEDPANPNKHHNTSTNLQRFDNTILFEDFFSHISGTSPSHDGSRHGHEGLEDTEDTHQQLRLDTLDDCLKGSSTSNQKKDSIDSELQIQEVPSSTSWLYATPQSTVQQAENSLIYGEESTSSWPSKTPRVTKKVDASCASNRVSPGAESVDKPRAQEYASEGHQETPITDPHAFLHKQSTHEPSNPPHYHCSQPHEMNKRSQLESEPVINPSDAQGHKVSSNRQHITNTPKRTAEVFGNEGRIAFVDNEQTHLKNSPTEPNSKEKVHLTDAANVNTNSSKARNGKAESIKKDAVDWESLRRQVLSNGRKIERSEDAIDSLDYEAMRNADISEISDVIKERGMNNMLAARIKDFLNRLVTEHGSIDLEWLRDIAPDKAKDYLLSIRGLGLKSVECVRLLTLHHLAFPVDTNVGRIAVRLGWVPLQPLPESLQLHLLELYPVLESIQKYLWPRLCKLDQRSLYELHYQMITFGKVFCTKSRPNCNACPMRAECRHFASAFASARLALPAPEEKTMVTSTVPLTTEKSPGIVIDPLPLPPPEDSLFKGRGTDIVSCIPIIEEPATPEQEHTEVIESDIEDIFYEDPDEIPTIKLNMEELTTNLQNYMQANMELQECDMSKALVALNPEAASIPTPKLKNVSRLRTEHQVYELPDSHPLLNGMDKREPDDPSPYLLAIWTPGETANSVQPPERHCQFQGPDNLCNEQTCFSCNSIRESNSQTVRGTLLIPCRTAMRGSFPLNGTYFQVNEVFADHGSSLNPIDVPRAWIWNLPRRMVYFGTSVSTIFKGLSTEGIQYCFWKGFVCVRGFDQKTRAPRPLMARLHFPASKLAKTKKDAQQ